MAYKAPIWEDGKSPAISAENLNALSQAAEGAQVLCGNSAPTSSTEGAVGQFYLVVVADSDGNYPLYQCVAIANGSYVWRDTRRIPDSITSMLGIPAPGTINGALNVLANIGNVHVWQRVQTYADPVPEVPAGYTLGAVETDVLLVSKAGETSVSISYSDSISVDANGNVSLASVNTISYVISEWREHYSVLQGKFCQVMDSTSGGITDAGASIFFFPSDAILEYAQAANYKLTLTAKKYQSVTGYPYTPAIPAGTHVDYLTSTDRNAYTAGTVGNTTITYLGQLGGGARIEVVSYVGTGTYGVNNPCSITADFKIKAVLYVAEMRDGRLIPGGTSYYDTDSMFSDILTTNFIVGKGLYSGEPGFYNIGYGKKSADGKTFYWYSSKDAESQLNYSSSTYFLVVIS